MRTCERGSHDKDVNERKACEFSELHHITAVGNCFKLSKGIVHVIEYDDNQIKLRIKRNDDVDLPTLLVMGKLSERVDSKQINKKDLHSIIDRMYEDGAFDKDQTLYANCSVSNHCAEYFVMPNPNMRVKFRNKI